MGNRYVKLDEKKMKMSMDAMDLYGRALSELLPHEDSEIDRNSHG